MLDDLAFAVESKDVNASSFLAGPIQITTCMTARSPSMAHVSPRRECCRLLDVGNDAVEPVRESGLC